MEFFIYPYQDSSQKIDNPCVKTDDPPAKTSFEEEPCITNKMNPDQGLMTRNYTQGAASPGTYNTRRENARPDVSGPKPQLRPETNRH